MFSTGAFRQRVHEIEHLVLGCLYSPVHPVVLSNVKDRHKIRQHHAPRPMMAKLLFFCHCTKGIRGFLMTALSLRVLATDGP